MQGCLEDDPPPTRIGTNVWPGYEPGYLAQQLGYFPEGAAKMVQFLSATENLRAFRNGSVDVAALTLDEVMLLQQNGVDVRVILVADISHGADVIIARSGIASMADLQGRRVAVESTALGAFVLTRAMALHGLPAGSVTTIPITVDESEAVFLSGEADAVVTFEPMRTQLLARGGREIFSSREMPNDIVDVLVTRADYLRRHQARLQGITAGWLRAVAYLARHPEDAAARIAPRLDLSPEEVLAAYQGLVLPDYDANLELLGGSAPQLAASARKLADVMLEQKLLSRQISTRDLLTDAALLRSD